jgi:hypothetical protein
VPGTASHQSDITSLPARSAAEVCQDSRQPELAKPAALMEWSTPKIEEVEYTPELRRLYCEATDGRDACAATER